MRTFEKLSEGLLNNLAVAGTIGAATLAGISPTSAEAKSKELIVNVESQINKAITNIVSSINAPHSAITTNFVRKVIELERNKKNPNVSKFDVTGTAKGLMQIHKGAWADTVRRYNLKAPNGATLDYTTYGTKIYSNIRVGTYYLFDIEKRLKAAIGADPTAEQIYAGWNAGIANLAKYNFNVDNLAAANSVFSQNLERFRSVSESLDPRLYADALHQRCLNVKKFRKGKKKGTYKNPTDSKLSTQGTMYRAQPQTGDAPSSSTYMSQG